MLTSRGDIRLGGGVTGTRLLELDAAQLYPYGSAIGRIPNFADWATIKATERVRIGRTTDTVPEMPYSLFGGVRIWSPAIEQGGILRAPMGRSSSAKPATASATTTTARWWPIP